MVKIYKINGRMKEKKDRHKDKNREICVKKLRNNIEKKKRIGETKRDNLREKYRNRGDKKTRHSLILSNYKKILSV
jgi:hypothetical protein